MHYPNVCYTENNEYKRPQINISTQQIHEKPGIANGSRRKRKRKKAINLLLDDGNDNEKINNQIPKPSTNAHNHDDEEKIEQSSIPQFTSSAPLSTFTAFKVRVAIDFGTDGIGMLCDQYKHYYSNQQNQKTKLLIYIALAYAIGEINDIKAHSEWAGKKFKPKFKPKTIILLDENGEVLGFGKDAKHTFSLITFLYLIFILLHNFHDLTDIWQPSE